MQRKPIGSLREHKTLKTKIKSRESPRKKGNFKQFQKDKVN